MTPDLAALAARALALPGAGRRLLGIAGAPGAGKSSLAMALAERTGGVVVPMDGFHLSDDELRRLARHDRKGAPDTFDALRYVELLRRLRSDPATVRAPDFDRAAETVRADAIEVPPRALVITEGNYLLLPAPPWDGVRALLDEVWFVQGDEPTRVERLVARFVEFGWDEAAARQRVTDGSDAANARLIVATACRADLIVEV